MSSAHASPLFHRMYKVLPRISRDLATTLRQNSTVVCPFLQLGKPRFRWLTRSHRMMARRRHKSGRLFRPSILCSNCLASQKPPNTDSCALTVKARGNVAAALMGVKQSHRNDLAYCCWGSGHGDAPAEGQQGSCFQLKPEAASALLDLPGRGNPEKKAIERRTSH